MTLKEYKQKRNFKKTSEPKPLIKKLKSKKLIYVVQKHHASHLHYDLRLEIKGVLKSWVIPKSPPTKKNVKRLAIQVEDHPLGYEKFSGIIPKGQYGGGEVEIWDHGFYELKEKNKKKIEIIIHGKKLKGHYVLIKTNYGSKPEKSWLFFKV
jgi:DNA ligase D-like protein (predicted 3'-phosphoesterase)|tara:strand:+ start:702 stop:1157 length:456 start_codon:yes stop_codon:yes gene_type:complete